MLLHKVIYHFIQLADRVLGTFGQFAGGALDLPLVLGSGHVPTAPSAAPAAMPTNREPVGLE